LVSTDISVITALPTSVTKNDPVLGEKVLQHVAVWLLSETDEEPVIWPDFASKLDTDTPNPASVLRRVSPEVPTRVILNGNTPLLGVDFTGDVAKEIPQFAVVTAKLAMNPGAAVGLPLTETRRLDSSWLKMISDTVLAGPVGGFVWFNPSDLTVFVKAVIPFFETAKQARFDCPPELRTHAALFFGEYATATGNSPIVFVGPPIIVN
jgi:hypothetical protein